MIMIIFDAIITDCNYFWCNYKGINDYYPV